MQPNEITEVLNRPISQELLARDLTRAALALADLDGEPNPRWPGQSPQEATGPEVRDSGQLLQRVALG